MVRIFVFLCFVVFPAVWGGGNEESMGSCGDPVALRAQLEAEFEVEKDEWRQEFSERVALWENDKLAAAGELDADGHAVVGGGGGDDSHVDEALLLRRRHAAELRVELDAMQHPDPDHCHSVGQLHFNYRNMGFGAAWHGLTLALTYGYATRRTVTVDPQPLRWIWADKQRCADGATMECWYESFTGCRARIEGAHRDPEYAQVDTEYKNDHVEFDWHQFAAGARANAPLDPLPRSVFMKGQVWNRGNDYVPPKYRQHGVMWWRSQLMGYVVRPRPAVLQEARGRAADHGLELPVRRPCVGVHVRRGAKWMELRDKQFPPLARYFEKVRQLAAGQSDQHARWTVFLATDDQGVLDEARASYGEEFDVQYNPAASRHSAGQNVTWMDEVRARWKHAPDDALDLMLDVWTLADCNYFVGSFSSNIGRAIAELHYYRTNENPVGKTAFSVDEDYKLDP